MKNVFQPIQKFIQEVKDYLEKISDVRFIEETFLEADGKIKVIDSAILRNDETLAIFEYKPGAKDITPQDFYEAFPPPDISYKFLVLSTGKLHKVLDRYSSESVTFTSTDELLSFLLATQKRSATIKNDIATTIEQSVRDFFKDFDLKQHPLSKNKTELTAYFSQDKIRKNIQFNKGGQFYHFSQDIRNLGNFENTFFKLVTEEVQPDDFIYRYTSLDTVFSTINYQSLRFNGIVGMNDISEVGYVESYLDSAFVPMNDDKDIAAINNRFILCSSTLSDDLMQWRLYANDCMGACLKFKVRESTTLAGLQLRKISYGIEKNGKNYHPELALIAKIINDVKIQHKQSIQFRALGIWKHFFKSFEYQPEQEVRLLLIRSTNSSIKGDQGLNEIDKAWCLTASHQIVNPYVTIPLDSSTLPIELTEVILGAKCPEAIINKKQFKRLLKEKSFSNVATSLSRINNYR